MYGNTLPRMIDNESFNRKEELYYTSNIVGDFVENFSEMIGSLTRNRDQLLKSSPIAWRDRDILISPLLAPHAW